MPVTSLTSNIQYTAGGILASFAVPFYFINQGDLLVQSSNPATGAIINYVLNTDYTITGTPNTFGDYSNGGTVNFNIVPATGLLILIQRVTRRDQVVQFIDNSPFTADSLNHCLDKLTLIAQEGGSAITVGGGLPGFLGLALGPPASVIGFLPNSWFMNAQFAAGSVFGWVLVAGAWKSFGPISL